ncbi:uncharacterized protein LOC119007276 [Acanthopagrus latus]|uniref:uncharacterized protein LOC119007276 n=1 Tax=Acanthopagrus latus TaxID=8177 RepID=UPI00187D07F7|nr:uncharacterized protein LOC119007276 [Acanthopagrus latus]
MHQHAHQHAFTPYLHQSLTVRPAPAGTQDSEFNMHLVRGSDKSSFAPVTAFHRTQKSVRPTKRGRWGSLHVFIAWRIHYDKQLKRIQQKPRSLHQQATPERPVNGPPDSVQQKESDQRCCRDPDLDLSCGHSRKPSETFSHFNRTYPSDLYASSPCCSCPTQREKSEQPPNLHWREKLAEKEKQHGRQLTTTAKDLLLRDKSWDQAVTPELDGRHSDSLARKRSLEGDSFVKVKRAKQEYINDQFNSSHPPSQPLPVQHRSDLSVLYPVSSVTRTPYPSAEMHPYHTASWEPVWNLHSRQNVLRDCSANTCKSIRIPLVAQGQRETPHGFCTPPLYLPLSLRQQETLYLRGRESLHSRPENSQLQHCGYRLTHPGFLAKSHLGP